MPCSKFISIRLEPGKETRVYVDKMSGPKSIPGLRTFSLQSLTGTHSNKGTAVCIEAFRWQPPGYDAPVALALNSQWPFGTAYIESNDTAGSAAGRSFSSVEFTYDEPARKLSWNQAGTNPPGKLLGSVEFNGRTPVWYIVLTLDPQAPATKGELLVGGADIS
jgi:hypothetical protein